ncbi:MAG: OmpA family protein, partial [Myxococcales bacterium]
MTLLDFVSRPTRWPLACAAAAVALLSSLPGEAAAATKDDPACKDHPAFTRMPNYYLRDKRFDCVETAFDSQSFLVDGKKVDVEGKKIRLQYEFDKSSGPAPSPLQIQRNYANAVRAAGGKVLHEDKGGYRDLYAKLEKDEREIWAWVRSLNDGNKVHVVIIEKEQMKQDVIASAEALAAGIRETGKVAVYGIYFDTGKAELKKESDAALEEMAKLLKSDQSLKVHIVGHTDSTGSFDSNLKLSQARAVSVVKALVSRYSI